MAWVYPLLGSSITEGEIILLREYSGMLNESQMAVLTRFDKFSGWDRHSCLSDRSDKFRRNGFAKYLTYRYIEIG